jgi:hypothetical protein
MKQFNNECHDRVTRMGIVHLYNNVPVCGSWHRYNWAALPMVVSSIECVRAFRVKALLAGEV